VFSGRKNRSRSIRDFIEAAARTAPQNAIKSPAVHYLLIGRIAAQSRSQTPIVKCLSSFPHFETSWDILTVWYISQYLRHYDKFKIFWDIFSRIWWKSLRCRFAGFEEALTGVFFKPNSGQFSFDFQPLVKSVLALLAPSCPLGIEAGVPHSINVLHSAEVASENTSDC